MINQVLPGWHVLRYSEEVFREFRDHLGFGLKGRFYQPRPKAWERRRREYMALKIA